MTTHIHTQFFLKTELKSLRNSIKLNVQFLAFFHVRRNMSVLCRNGKSNPFEGRPARWWIKTKSKICEGMVKLEDLFPRRREINSRLSRAWGRFRRSLWAESLQSPFYSYLMRRQYFTTQKYLRLSELRLRSQFYNNPLETLRPFPDEGTYSYISAFLLRICIFTRRLLRPFCIENSPQDRARIERLWGVFMGIL